MCAEYTRTRASAFIALSIRFVWFLDGTLQHQHHHTPIASLAHSAKRNYGLCECVSVCVSKTCTMHTIRTWPSADRPRTSRRHSHCQSQLNGRKPFDGCVCVCDLRREPDGTFTAKAHHSRIELCLNESQHAVCVSAK